MIYLFGRPGGRSRLRLTGLPKRRREYILTWLLPNAQSPSYRGQGQTHLGRSDFQSDSVSSLGAACTIPPVIVYGIDAKHVSVMISFVDSCRKAWDFRVSPAVL